MNKMIRSILSLTLFAIFLSTPVYCVLNEVGINPLNLNVGARPGSMGGAYTAVSDDMNSILYNPAAISMNKGLMFMIQDTKNFSIAQAATIPNGTVGLGLVYSGFSDFAYQSSTASYDNSLVFIGYGFSLDDTPYLANCKLGFNYKYLLNQRLSPLSGPDLSSSGSSGIDIGFLYAPEESWMQWGLGFCNAFNSASYKLGATTEAESGRTSLGIAVKIIGEQNRALFYSDSFGLLVSIDQGLSGKAENRESLEEGLELSLFKNFALRCGVKQVLKSGTDKSYSSYGMGVKLGPNLNLDLSSQEDPITEKRISVLSLVYMPPVFAWVPAAEEELPRDFIKVTYPPTDYITYNETLRVQGYVRKGTDIYVNDVMAYVGDNLDFSVEVPLNPGKNLIEVKGTLNKKSEVIQLKVLRKAKVIIAEEEQIERAIKVDIKNRENELNLRGAQIAEQLKKAKDEAEKKRLELEAQKIVQEQAQLETQKGFLEGKKKSIEERKEKVENLVTLGVIEVSPSKKFEIEAKITKGEMVSWLVKAANISISPVTSNVCADVPVSHKYAPYIKAALDDGLIKTDANNKFYPDSAVNELEGEQLFKQFGVIK